MRLFETRREASNLRMNEFLAAAKKYRALGLHPIPVEPRGKRPVLESWREFCDRPPTERELDEWWANSPDANVALITGRGIFAVDIDGPEGEAALEAAGVELPVTAPAVTTGKGRHVFFSGQATNRVGVLTKVDIRGDGGYVVAPPSIHPSGKRYTWVTSLVALPDPAPPALRAVLDRPTKPAPDQKADDWLTVALAGVGEGQRDQTCARLAGYLLSKGMPQDVVMTLLLDWGTKCTPPFPEAEVEKCVASIGKRHEPAAEAAAPTGIAVAVDETLADIKSGTKSVRATELCALDTLLDGGIRPGDYVLLAARPSVGKTALAMQIARRVAKSGQGVLVVSREMTRTALVRRLLVQEAQVRASSVRAGALVDIEWEMLKSGAQRLRTLPIWITTDAVGIVQIEEALAGFAPGQLGLVVVDYLQLVRPPADMRDRRAGIEFVSQELKRFAGKHSLALLCLSSLSRPPKDAGKNWRPQLSDLRESGELEHDADIVILLHREFQSDICEVNVGKNRDGRVGTVRLKFNGDLLSFEELTSE